MIARPEEIERAFAKAGPWQSRFLIDGRTYGGDLSYQEDRRVATFFDWVVAPTSVIELGSFEGAHSVQLAAQPSVERLLCLEGRDDHVRRARTAMAVLGLTDRVQVQRFDLEEADLSDFGSFDAAFCAGLFYHLTRPWLLLRELRQRVGMLFLDTHVSLTDNIVLAGHRGSLYREQGLDDPLSGLQDYSFWPTSEALDGMLAQAGFAVVRRQFWPEWPNGPRVHLLCEASLPPASAA